MSGLIGYWLGYSAGRDDSNLARRQKEIVDAIFDMRPRVTGPSYVDQLHAQIARLAGDSDHNFNKATMFRGEALEWKEKTQQFRGEALVWRDLAWKGEADTKALKAQVAALEAQLASEKAAHEKARDEVYGLRSFRVMATWLLDAHAAGKASHPAFAEIRDMAKAISDQIASGQAFDAYRDAPAKKERLRELLTALAAN